MPLLPCKDYVPPILFALRQHQEGLSGSELSERVANSTQLSEDERKDAISDGTPKYLVRIKQARYWLKTQGFVNALANGSWVLTTEGRQFLDETGGTPSKLSRPSRRAGVGTQQEEKAPATQPSRRDEDLEEAPLEQIDHALNRIHGALEVDILQRMSHSSPLFFERAVLALLKAMGYAGNLGKVEHTGGPGDGGIDGILYLDRLGLERVYVQAKKWENPVGTPELREFCGALSTNHAGKGVIISTSTFTEPAVKLAEKAPQAIGLIDGSELSKLMIEFGVGVSRTNTRVIPQLDQSFFVDI